MRGKHGAQAAKRRADDAQRTIADLDARLRAQSERSELEIQELKTALAQAKNRLVREVNTLSQAEVRAAREDAARRVAEIQQAADGRVHNAVRWLGHYVSDDSIDLGSDEFREAAGLIGLTIAEVAEDLGFGGAANRQAKRAAAGGGSRCAHGAGGCDCLQFVNLSPATAR